MNGLAGLGQIPFAVAFGTPIAAAVLSAAVISLSLPWLRSAAVALPNGRSSHRVPTPQGGGFGVVVSTLFTAWSVAYLSGAFSSADMLQFAVATAAAVLLAAVGLLDDMRGLSPLTRLLVQAAAVGMVVAAMPAEARITPQLPWWIERIGIVLAGIWFVNLTNFMDGIDWITIADVVPIAGAIAALGAVGIIPGSSMIVALSLLGAVVGFAPFNKPVARLFLGDVGSLPIGLLLGWLLLLLASRDHLVAALLLPLYCVADATLTLFRRVMRGEPPWRSHRGHFYQRAVDGGFTVQSVVAQVFAVNVALAALAVASIVSGSTAMSVAALAAGAALVGFLLIRFARGRKRTG